MRKTIVDIVCALALCAIVIAVGIAGQVSSRGDEYAQRTWFAFFKATGLSGLLLLYCLAWAVVKLVRCTLGQGEAALRNPVVASRVKPLLEAGDIDAAHSLAQADSTYASRVLAAALARRPAGREEMQRGLKQASAAESSRRMGEVSSLLWIAIVALLLGLAGTATGLINTFRIIELLREPTPADLAVGVYEALINMAIALLVAILCLPAYFSLKRSLSTRTLGINVEIGELLARTKLPA